MVIKLEQGIESSWKVYDKMIKSTANPAKQLAVRRGSDFKLSDKTLVESTIYYRPEDIIDKKGTTPFLFNFVVQFLNIESSLKSFLKDPISSKIDTISYTFELEYKKQSFIWSPPGDDSPKDLFSNVNHFMNTVNSLFGSSSDVGSKGGSSVSLAGDANSFIKISDAGNSLVFYSKPSDVTGTIFNIKDVIIQLSWEGNYVLVSLSDYKVLEFVGSLAFVEQCFAELIDNLSSLQTVDVYYKRIKCLTFKILNDKITHFNLGDCSNLSDCFFNFNNDVTGKNSNDLANTDKVLGYSIEFDHTTLVSRRQVGYTCFPSSKAARADQTANKLGKTLRETKYFKSLFDFSLTPVYHRDKVFVNAIGCSIEGMRFTASKKRGFVKEVYQVK